MPLPVFTNIVFPALASLFLMACSLYFFSIRGETHRTARAFAWFLLSFAVFLAGRPVQVLVGEHPLPLLVNSARIFVLCAVTMPMLVITAGIHNLGRLQIHPRAVILLGLAMGCIYVVFHALGTVGSYAMFSFGHHTAYASIMPTWAPPWYGREVSLAVQFLIGAILAAGSAAKCLQIWHEGRLAGTRSWHLILLYAGVIAFGTSFAIGSLIKQWAVYYAGATVSTLIVGIGVIVDIYNTSRTIEDSGPFIREAILRHLLSPANSSDGIAQALRLLGRSEKLDGFAVFGAQSAPGEAPDLAAQGALLESVRAGLERHLQLEDYLVLPLSTNTLGVAYASAALDREAALSLCETLASQAGRGSRRRICVGIGRSHGNATDLRSAYSEALVAHEIAERSNESLVIHAESIMAETAQAPYPHQAQGELLTCVRLGEAGTVGAKVAACFDGLKAFAAGNPATLRLRLYAMAGLILDAAQTGGGDASRIEALNARAFEALESANDLACMRNAIQTLSADAAALVAESHGRLSHGAFVRACGFLAEHYQTALTLEEVASAVAISPSYLAHLFKKESGVSFSKYLTDLRLKAARRLLLASTRSITEIAQDVGYNDSNYFSTVFRTNEGVSPSEYRRLNRAGQTPTC